MGNDIASTIGLAYFVDQSCAERQSILIVSIKIWPDFHFTVIFCCNSIDLKMKYRIIFNHKKYNQLLCHSMVLTFEHSATLSRPLFKRSKTKNHLVLKSIYMSHLSRL